MVETPEQTVVATIVPPNVVPVPPTPLPPEPPPAQPPMPSADRAHLDTLQELLKLQQQATQTALDQIEEIKKQLAAPQPPPQPEIEEPVQKAPDVVPANIPAPAVEYWPPARVELPEISPKYTGLVAAVITLAAALTIIVCWAIFWASSGHPLPWVDHPQVVPPAASLPTGVHEAYPDPPSTAFAVAVAGLNDAFARFPGVPPNDILWELLGVIVPAWCSGTMAIRHSSSGREHPIPSSLAFTIGQCADAVRHLPKVRPQYL